MANIIILLCCTIAFASAFSVPSDNVQKIVAVQVIESIEDFIRENPEAEVIPMEKDETNVNARAKAPIRYTLGARNGYDSVVASGNNQYYYPSLQDVNLQLNYPQTGVGKIVSFVEVNVEQSSNTGRAYVIAGAIGQRYIRVAIEAKQTSFFRYRAQFFGY